MTMPAPDLHALLNTTIFVALFSFIVYRRIRRSIGRQPLRPRRMMVRIGFVALIGVLILTLRHPGLNVFAAAAVGLVLGAVLAVYALKHTRFEVTNEGTFYTGHPYIGLGVAMLVIGRVLYRMIQAPGMMGGGPPPAGPGAALATSFANPFTTGAFFVMAGYYLVYYTGLVRNRPQDPLQVRPPVHEKPDVPSGGTPDGSQDNAANVL